MTENIRRNGDDIASIIKVEENEFNCNKLKAKESAAKDITSGYQTYIDLERMNLTINGIKIDKSLIEDLLNKAENNSENKALKNLIDNKLDDKTIEILTTEPREDFSNLLHYCNKQYYHSVLTEVFAKIFQCAGVKIPNEHLMSELIINLNQAGYYGTLYHNVFAPSAVKCDLIPHNSKQMVYVNCTDSNEINLRIDEKMDMSKPDCNNPKEEVLASLSGSVTFTLQNDKNNNVSYTGGELSNIALQVSEDWNLEQGLFAKLIEWVKAFMEDNLGIKINRIKITNLDKPKSEVVDATVQPYEQKLVSY